ncbi:hypothetical protein HYH03_001282 [Edaphochlamys debaryana]|uniref:SAP domain-containing protein n=1 Tax=Edaphochlamys debaryana TaxID=47281 RepID=A0A835YCS0_9CHLO|nr:hypothetical protein HYH03_001282 [Edaphochlamys debaryana]|eukprot:KAG2500505.1 hypothetical protein HYH03_001282 [Edaphochlamys debaryana]
MTVLKELLDLPSRGPLPESEVPQVRDPPHYICTHDTKPPLGQTITTEQGTSALLRVVLRKRDSTAVSKKSEAAQPTAAGKRPPADDAGGKEARPSKKPNTGAKEAVPAAALTVYTADQLKSKTIPQLKELLRARSLAVSGAKDELVRRIIDHQRAQKEAAL